jgi:hypothetical protein
VLAPQEASVVAIVDAFAQATRRPATVNLHTTATANAMGNSAEFLDYPKNYDAIRQIDNRDPPHRGSPDLLCSGYSNRQALHKIIWVRSPSLGTYRDRP